MVNSIAVRSKKRRRHFKRFLPGYIMLLPGFLLTLVFSYIPFGGLYMAFSNFRLGFPIFSAEFVGLQHIRTVFFESMEVRWVLRNTLVMNIGGLLVGLPSAMFFAIALNEVRVKSVKVVFQTFSFMPFLLSWVVAYNMILAFLATEEGIINVALRNWGIIEHGIPIMSDPRFSWGLIILSSLWKGLGYGAVLFLSAIAGIDQELYDAAQVDGATRLQQAWHITVPYLLPTLQILLILNTGWILSSSLEQFYLFTNTMNRSTMEVFDVYIMRFGLRLLRFSFATAVGLMRSLVGITLLILVNIISSRINKVSVV